MTVISKSPNKHNRIYLEAEPLGEEFCKAVDSGTIKPDMDSKERAKILEKDHKWDVTDARKIWSMGCPPEGLPNVVVDMTKGVSYLTEIKDSVVGAFQQVTLCGPIAEETMRGVRFNIMDVVLHADAIHRGAGQIMPPMKRATCAAIMKSAPCLLEPMYVCDITVPQSAISGVYSTLNARRGIVEGKEDRAGTPLSIVKAFLPVLESFGFTSVLRQNTGGQAFPQMVFSHWSLLSGDPWESDSQANTIALSVRKRKGLKSEMPDFNDFHDKL